MLNFTIGMFLGAIIGTFGVALCVAGRDDRPE